MSLGESTSPRFTSPGKFHPQGFSPSRRFTPRRDDQPYFRLEAPLGFSLQGVSPATRSLWFTTIERPSWRFFLSTHIRRPEHLGASSTHPKMSVKVFVAPSRHHSSSGSVLPFVTEATPDNRSPHGLQLSRVSSTSTLAPIARNTARVILSANLPTFGKPRVGSFTDRHLSVFEWARCHLFLKRQLPL